MSFVVVSILSVSVPGLRRIPSHLIKQGRPLLPQCRIIHGRVESESLYLARANDWATITGCPSNFIVESGKDLARLLRFLVNKGFPCLPLDPLLLDDNFPAVSSSSSSWWLKASAEKGNSSGWIGGEGHFRVLSNFWFDEKNSSGQSEEERNQNLARKIAVEINTRLFCEGILFIFINSHLWLISGKPVYQKSHFSFDLGNNFWDIVVNNCYDRKS